MPRYAATFYMNPGQYTPNRKRADGKGFEPDYIEANSFKEAAPLAQQLYQRKPMSILGTQLPDPGHILLIAHDRDDPTGLYAVSYEYETLKLVGGDKLKAPLTIADLEP